jgi:hypothetical protein
MRPGIFYAFALLTFCAICSTLPALGSDSDQHPVFSATDLKVENRPEGRDDIRSIPFDDNRDQVSVALPDGTHKTVHVELKATLYNVTLVKQTDSQTTTSPESWSCYELQSKDKDVPYTWYMWRGDVIGRFKLFVTADGDTYLTYVHSDVVHLVEVSHPMDQADEVKTLNKGLNHEETAVVQYVNVNQTIPHDPDVHLFFDKNTADHYFSIYLTSLEKDGKGGFKLQLHGGDASKTYTLVTDKETKLGWRLVE